MAPARATNGATAALPSCRASRAANSAGVGAGYRLAQRDLQIRGGGDIIGVAQHGNSSKVGYQKYCDLLADEIAKIKGEKRAHVEVQVSFPAVIPGDYLPQENLRVTLYRRLLKVESPAEAEALREETVDRFGRLPQSVSFLFDLACVRAAAPDLQITKLLCSRYETVAVGVPDGGWEQLKLPPRWMKRLDGLVGPGGFAGMELLCEAVKRQTLTNLLQ